MQIENNIILALDLTNLNQALAVPYRQLGVAQRWRCAKQSRHYLVQIGSGHVSLPPDLLQNRDAPLSRSETFPLSMQNGLLDSDAHQNDPKRRARKRIPRPPP